MSRPGTSASQKSINLEAQPGSATSHSTFRNVSACNRCRIRKNRCDQRLPRCQSCEKAKVHCVGYDPATKREIPRSYVFFLESRVAYLEALLKENGVAFRPPEAHEGEGDELRQADVARASAAAAAAGGGRDTAHAREAGTKDKLPLNNSNENIPGSGDARVKREPTSPLSVAVKATTRSNSSLYSSRKSLTDDANRRIDKLVSSVGMVPVQGTSDPRYLGSTSGISFARVVFSAVRCSVSSSVSERGSIRPGSRRQSAAANANKNGGDGASGGGMHSMRDSYFGLQTKPIMKQAPFPDREVAQRLVNLYFEYSNAQIPILHRVEFMEVFDRVYAMEEKQRSARDLYFLNIVCAIGAGVIFDAKGDSESTSQEMKNENDTRSPSPSPAYKRRRLSNQQHQPEEYHASAVVHLESCLGSSSSTDGFGGGLEELQAVLLLASFALLRPVAPGLWYIAGVAVRLAIDLGLHHEDGTGVDSIDEVEVARRMSRMDSIDERSSEQVRAKLKVDPRERGRREFVRDFRRRLWWCVYSFDRLVSTCVGRPFGITDQVITTEFPSLLDDEYITKAGFVAAPPGAPSYKLVAHHYFKLRLLQSEIQEVLQHQQAMLARKNGRNRNNSFMHTKLPSPFLQKFDSFRSWRIDIHRRLDEWIQSSPKAHEIGVQFSLQFLELNYWQTLISLYRQSLTVPKPLASERTPTEDVSSPSLASVEEPEDEDDVYLMVAEAGQKVLRIYRQLHRVRLVNFTYLATHHLFMAGISFLYAIWHSPAVRSRLTLDDVDFTVLAATSVLKDLIEKCPPAEACRDAFERMSKATVQMGLSTTGFGQQVGAGERLSTHSLSAQSRPQHQNHNQNSDGQYFYNTPVYKPHPQHPYFHGPRFSRTLDPIPEQPAGPRPAEPSTDNRFSINNFLSNPVDSSRTGKTQSSSPPQFHDHRDIPSRAASTTPEKRSPKSASCQLEEPFTPSQFNSQLQAASQRQQQQQQQQQQLPPPPSHHPPTHNYTYTDPFANRTPQPNPHQHQFHSPQATSQAGTQFYVSGLDLLNSPSRPYTSDSQVVYTSGEGIDIDLSSLPLYSPDSTHGAMTGNSALDLGFGVGTAVDFQHDWSENTGFDLFDGLFFGGGG
ncbi:purine utilization positive regulator [Nannizzia gypsea CBS 118893]|uniref:Purine utilization positive regulator n=1 Tax=Arthroderma gypseum (strain ATCC MYA-4604 / CBS 118893) TaxID=535722 RepID=E5R1K0_ARTGP|nr:purine utilization positive regulator [Nannizzia gypsea CBS 118893]EFQ98536.1 purine utilization positive regulator [Nannizzia gypsea CBS 118893]